MANRAFYEQQLREYADVVTVKEMMAMLGGICEKTAYQLLQQGRIQHFKIGSQYRIPKVSVIDYMMTEEFDTFRRKTEYYHLCRIQDKVERGQQKILFMCEKPQSRKDLMKMLDIASNKTFFRVYMRPLLDSGKMRLLYPDQPSISTQRYVRVEETPKRTVVKPRKRK